MLERMSRLIERGSCAVMAAALAVMVAGVFAQVIWRYLFESSIFWSEELIRYLMVWSAMFGAGVCLRRGLHLGVAALFNAFPPRVRRLVSQAVYLLILVFLGVVVWHGTLLSQRVWYQTSPTLFLPMGLVYLGVPLGALAMMVHTLALLTGVGPADGIETR